MLTHPIDYKGIVVFVLYRLAELLELSAVPLEFMVPVPELTLLELEEAVELPVGGGDKAILGL